MATIEDPPQEVIDNSIPKAFKLFLPGITVRI